MRELLFGTEPIQWVQQLFGLGHPLPFRIFSLLGDTWGVILVVGLALWVFGRKTMYALVGIVALGGATKLLLSSVFHHERPDGPGIVVYEHLEISSFPSGHVYEAVGPWGLLWVLGCIPFWVAALVAVLVSVGRFYLGVHYLGDLLAGVALAALLVWLYARAWPHASRWLARRGRVFYAVLAVGAAGGVAAWVALAGGNPRRYEVLGMIIGAAAALPLEHRLLRYRPLPASGPERMLQVVIGVAGIAALLLWDRSQGEQALMPGAWAAGLATLWTVLGAPALFRTLGLGTARR